MASVGKPLGAAVAAFPFTAAGASAQEVKHYRFAYDQPMSTGYGILGSFANAATLLPQASTSPLSSPLPIPIPTISPGNSDRIPRKSRT